MKIIPFATALTLASLAGTAAAEDLCDVAEADRQPIEALQRKLESEGWTVKKMKIDDGCYEAYATDVEGQRVEAYFDPRTFALIKSEVD